MAKERCSAYVPRVVGPFQEGIDDLDVIGGYLPDLGEVPIPDNQDILMFIEEEKRANGVRMIECLTVEDVNRLLEMVPNRRNPMNAFLLHLQRPIMRNWIEPFRRGQMTFLLRLQEDGSVLPFPINRQDIFELFDRDDARPREIEEMDVPPQVKEQARAEWREEFNQRLQALINANRQNVPALAEEPAPVLNNEEEQQRDVQILRRLIFDENYDQLRELIRHGIDFDVISEILPELFDRGRRNIIEMFVQRGVMHEGILYTAVQRDDIDIVRLCVERGMRFDGALTLAISENNIRMVRFLLDNGFRSRDALEVAINIGINIEIIRLLLDAELPFNVRMLEIPDNNIDDDSIRLIFDNQHLENVELFLAVKHGDEARIRQLLREERNIGNVNMLKNAIGDINIFRLLLENGFSTEEQRRDCLITAIKYHQLPTVEILVNDFNIRSNNALKQAVKAGDINILRFLIQAGGFEVGELNIHDFYDGRLLRLVIENNINIEMERFELAVISNNIQQVEGFIREGIRGDRRINNIEYAVSTGNIALVRLLLQNNIGNNDQRIVGANSAVENNMFDIVRLIVEEFNIRNNSLLRSAVFADNINLEMVRYLCDQGMFSRRLVLHARNELHNEELAEILERDPRNA